MPVIYYKIKSSKKEIITYVRRSINDDGDYLKIKNQNLVFNLEENIDLIR